MLQTRGDLPHTPTTKPLQTLIHSSTILASQEAATQPPSVHYTRNLTPACQGGAVEVGWGFVGVVGVRRGADGGLEGWGVGVTHPSWDSGPGRDLRHPLTSVPAPFSLFEWEWGEIEGTRDNVESSSVG